MKHSGISKVNLKILVVFLFFFAFICFGCSKSQESSVAVPPDVQQFLDKYFAVVKSRDIAQIQDMSAYVPASQSQDMQPDQVDMMREEKKKFASQVFDKVFNEFGDLESYSVASIKTTTIAVGTPGANTMGPGVYVSVVCKAKFSKNKKVQVNLQLFKENEGTDYSVLAYTYQAGL